MSGRRGILCRLGLHRWDYSGNAHTHAPAPIRCERCGKRLGVVVARGLDGMRRPETWRHHQQHDAPGGRAGMEEDE